MGKNILVVLTSHDRLGETGHQTGFWLEELATPYYVFKDAGAVVTLASPDGGKPPLDPKSDDVSSETPATIRFKADTVANEQLANTAKLQDVDASNFDAVFYPGGHGPLWDLIDNKQSIKLIEAFWTQGKPVSAVCHAPIALVNAKDENGEFIVKGREVTGFTNEEEEAVGLTNIVPQLVEDVMIERGANYSKKESWASFACKDGNLITGQNPASSEAVAELLLKALN
jgi:putative intracellular protease/amidase